MPVSEIVFGQIMTVSSTTEEKKCCFSGGYGNNKCCYVKLIVEFEKK